MLLQKKKKTASSSPLDKKQKQLDFYIKQTELSKNSMAESAELSEPDYENQTHGKMKSDPMLKEILESVKPIPEMKRQLDGIVKDIADIKSTIETHDSEIKSLQESVAFNQADISGCRSELANLRDQIKELALEVGQTNILKIKNRELSKKVLDLETYSRRNNLLFYGIKENINEDCYISICSFLEEVMKIKLDKGSRPIQSAHRLGPKQIGTNRPIIVRFTNVSEANDIFRKRLCLRTSDSKYPGAARPNYYILQDYPERINQIRQQLKHVLVEAKKVDRQAYLRRDKLCFQNKFYDLADCYSISNLDVTKIGTRHQMDAVLFHGRFSPLSNFYPSRFEVDGIVFTCVEQYYSYSYAKFHRKDSIAAHVLQEDDPVDMKHLVNKLDKDPWHATKACDVMKVGLQAKFGQNPKLAETLKVTGNKLLIECNRHDNFWGNGVGLAQKEARTGKGLNRLGQLLMEVRDSM